MFLKRRKIGLFDAKIGLFFGERRAFWQLSTASDEFFQLLTSFGKCFSAALKRRKTGLFSASVLVTTIFDAAWSLVNRSLLTNVFDFLESLESDLRATNVFSASVLATFDDFR